jgi:hypothetical protein
MNTYRENIPREHDELKSRRGRRPGRVVERDPEEIIEKKREEAA